MLSRAKTAANIGWIANVLRPFGHLSVVDVGPPLDVSPLVLKSASLHTDMVFSRIIHGGEPERQGRILETVAALVVEGRVKPVAMTRLDGLTAVPRIANIGIDAGYNLNIPYTDGSRETIPLRGAFERFFSETCT